MRQGCFLFHKEKEPEAVVGLTEVELARPELEWNPNPFNEVNCAGRCPWDPGEMETPRASVGGRSVLLTGFQGSAGPSTTLRAD